ncbi:MAG: hypothetical protein AAF845_20560, partial [Bacteroidota bacterium]
MAPAPRRAPASGAGARCAEVLAGPEAEPSRGGVRLCGLDAGVVRLGEPEVAVDEGVANDQHGA